MKTQKNSSQVVVRERVKLFDDDTIENLTFTGLVGVIPSMFAPYFIIDPDSIQALLAAGVGIEGTILVGASGILYFRNVASKMSYMGKQSFKTYLKVMNPFTKRVSLSKKPAPIKLRQEISENKIQSIGYYSKKTMDHTATHEITADLVKTFTGVKIEQVFTETPGKVWDDAFESTLSIHKFTGKQIHP